MYMKFMPTNDSLHVLLLLLLLADNHKNQDTSLQEFYNSFMKLCSHLFCNMLFSYWRQKIELKWRLDY